MASAIKSAQLVRQLLDYWGLERRQINTINLAPIVITVWRRMGLACPLYHDLQMLAARKWAKPRPGLVVCVYLTFSLYRDSGWYRLDQLCNMGVVLVIPDVRHGRSTGYTRCAVWTWY